MTVEVIVPWRAGCPHRQRAWDWVRTAHESNGFAVTEAPGPDPWCKAASVTPAAEASEADVIVIADADVWCDDIDAAVQHVTDHGGWAVPHLQVHRLTAEATASTIANTPVARGRFEQRPYPGIVGGGIVVIERSLYFDIPLDPRFSGWGGEDQAWGYALRTLVGMPWRGKVPLIHLWHPPQPRKNRKVGNDANERLRRRYQACRLNPDRMQTLVQEAREQLWTSPGTSQHPA